MSGGTEVKDERGYPPYVVLYIEEVESVEVLSLSGSSLLAWVFLNNQCNKTDYHKEREWFVSWARLAKRMDCSPATVGRALDKLEDKGLIERRRRGVGRTNQIVLHRPPSLVKNTQTCESANTQSCNTQTVSSATRDSSPSASPNIFRKTSSPTGYKGKTSRKNEPLYKRVGGHSNKSQESQAINEEDMPAVVEVWSLMIDDLANREPDILESLKTYHRVQPSVFIEEINRITGEDSTVIELMMNTPGFATELFAGGE
jgi:DNA-binding transcriptional regulator YhcF (GntR family)